MFNNAGRACDIKAKQYTDIAISIMNQLAQDIYISIDLFKFSDWETFVLQDALKLLRYTLDNLFGGGDTESGKAKGLGVAYKCCTDSSLKKNSSRREKKLGRLAQSPKC